MTAPPKKQRRSAWRIAATMVLVLVIAPGNFLRTDVRPSYVQQLEINPLSDDALLDRRGPLRREGLWELNSANSSFGGYSALLRLSDGNLRAFSDRGAMLTFSPPVTGAGDVVHFAAVTQRGPFQKAIPDIESAVQDASSGDYWLGFENFHGVLRYNAAGELTGLRKPPAWQNWPINSGAEAMMRLPDGRFVVLPEANADGLIYAGDPVLVGLPPAAFRFDGPEGYRPTDMVSLPDGRVLVLLRRLEWGLPPFSVVLAMGDASAIREGEVWRVEQLALLDTILPRENYEGIAAYPRADGDIDVWLISDDNQAAIQRTLLARLVLEAPAQDEQAIQ